MISKRIKECSIPLMTVLLIPGICCSADWRTTDVDTQLQDFCPETYWSSIQVDELGYPCIAYNFTNPWELRYAFWDGVSWQKEIADYSEDGSLWEPSLTLDYSNSPHIAYTYVSFPQVFYVRYAWKEGASWEISTIDSGEQYSPMRAHSLALDSQGYPCICYSYYKYQDYYVKYARLTPSGWYIQVVDQGFYPSLDLDSQDYPHIVYTEVDSGALKYAKWDGDSWEFQIVDSGGIGSIALDNQDHPAIIYTYGLDDMRLRYAHWDGSQWEIQEIDIGQEEWNIERPSLALDHFGYPHFSCLKYTQDYPQEYVLVYGFWDGTDWAFHSIDLYTWSSCSLALDTQDNPHISFFDNSETVDIHTLEYSWYGDPLTAISLLSFTATPQDNAIALNWRVEATEGEQIAGFNLYRREMGAGAEGGVRADGHPPLQKDDTYPWTQVNPSLITGQNPYAYADNTVEPGKSYEYRLEAVLGDESTEILGTASCAPTPPAFAITKVYPNPASDMLNIALILPQSGEVKLALYDISGRVVASKVIQVSSPGEFTDQLDMSGLANGVYTLQASQAGLSASERVVVVR